MPTYTDIGGAVASLRILDEFTAPIARAIEQLAALEEALGRFRAASRGLSAPFAGLTTALARVQAPLAALADKLAAMDAPISEAADRLVAVADRSAVIAASATEAAKAYASIGRMRGPAIAAPRPAVGAGGGGRRGGGIPGAVEGAAEGAGFGYMARKAFSVPGLAIGIAGFESFKQAMTENLALTQSLAMFNVAGANAAKQQQYLGMLRDIARESAIGTIFTEAETAKAMLGAAQMAGFSGKQGLAQFASVFPVALRMAEVGQMQGLGSISENIKAAIGYSHLTGRYSAAALVPGLDEVLAIAERTHSTITQTLTTMKYGIPMALASGANVDQAAEVLGFLMRAGLGRSAGYSLGQMLMGVLNTGGALNAHLATLRAGVAKALGPNAEKIKNMKAHAEALHALGILNASGQLTVLNATGGVDLGKIVADIQHYAATHEKADLAAVLHAAFGTRGMRGAVLLAEQAKRLEAFEKLVAGTPGAAAQQAMFAHTPLQEFEQLLARLQDIGNVLATELLPDLGKFLAFLDRTLGVVDRFLSEHHVVTGAAGGAAIGAAVGSIIPGVGTAIGAGVGAGVGAIVTMPEGKPVPHHMIGQATSNAALFGHLPGPIGTHGDPVFTHPLTAPPAPAVPAQVTIHAPLNVRIDGSLLGADYATLNFYMQGWLRQHAGEIGSAVRTTIDQTQQHHRRRTFVEHGFAGAAP